jgi:hypothetical protein
VQVQLSLKKKLLLLFSSPLLLFPIYGQQANGQLSTVHSSKSELIGKVISIPNLDEGTYKGKIVATLSDGLLLEAAEGPKKVPYGNLSEEIAISLGCEPAAYESLRYKEWKKYVVPYDCSLREPQKASAAAIQEAQRKAYDAKIAAVKESEKKRWAGYQAKVEKERQEVLEFEANHRNRSSYWSGGGAAGSSMGSSISSYQSGGGSAGSSMDSSGAVTTFSSGGFTTVSPIGGGSPHTIYTGASDGHSLGYRDACGYISTPSTAIPIYDPQH